MIKCEFIKYPQEGCYEIKLEGDGELVKDFEKIYYGKLDVHPSKLGFIIHGDYMGGYLILKILVSTNVSQSTSGRSGGEHLGGPNAGVARFGHAGKPNSNGCDDSQRSTSQPPDKQS